MLSKQILSDSTFIEFIVNSFGEDYNNKDICQNIIATPYNTESFIELLKKSKTKTKSFDEIFAQTDLDSDHFDLKSITIYKKKCYAGKADSGEYFCGVTDFYCEIEHFVKFTTKVSPKSISDFCSEKNNSNENMRSIAVNIMKNNYSHQFQRQNNIPNKDYFTTNPQCLENYNNFVETQKQMSEADNKPKSITSGKSVIHSIVKPKNLRNKRGDPTIEELVSFYQFIRSSDSSKTNNDIFIAIANNIRNNFENSQELLSTKPLKQKIQRAIEPLIENLRRATSMQSNAVKEFNDNKHRTIPIRPIHRLPIDEPAQSIDQTFASELSEQTQPDSIQSEFMPSQESTSSVAEITLSNEARRQIARVADRGHIRSRPLADIVNATLAAINAELGKSHNFNIKLNNYVTWHNQKQASRQESKQEIIDQIQKYLNEDPDNSLLISFDSKNINGQSNMAVLLDWGNDQSIIGIGSGVSKGSETADFVFNLIEEYKIDPARIEFIASDSTSSMTGRLNGAITQLENRLNKPCCWVLCWLHFCELALGRIIEFYFGKTTGNNTDTGKFRNFLEYLGENWDQFQITTETPISSEYQFDQDFDELVKSTANISDQLRNDQKQFFKLAELISGRRSNVDKSMIIRPGKITSARFLSQAIGIMLLCLYKNNIRNQITNPQFIDLLDNRFDKFESVLKFIITYYAPIWKLGLARSDLGWAPMNQFQALQQIEKLANNEEKIRIKQLFSDNHYYLTENVALILGNHSPRVRAAFANNCLDEAKKLDDNWNYNSERQFMLYKRRSAPKRNKTSTDILNQNFKFEQLLENYINSNTFNHPLFKDCQSKNELITLLENINNGDDPFSRIRRFRSNTRDIERTVRLMNETADYANSDEVRTSLAINILRDRKSNPVSGLSSNFK